MQYQSRVLVESLFSLSSMTLSFKTPWGSQPPPPIPLAKEAKYGKRAKIKPGLRHLKLYIEIFT